MKYRECPIRRKCCSDNPFCAPGECRLAYELDSLRRPRYVFTCGVDRGDGSPMLREKQGMAADVRVYLHIPYAPSRYFCDVALCPRCMQKSLITQLLDGEACPRCRLVL